MRVLLPSWNEMSQVSGAQADPLIRGRHQLTVDEARRGTRFDDAVARTAWPIELHDRAR